MRPSFRSALLLGSAIVSLTSSTAFADDPLLPEGATRPVMGKELVLPPVINEAPANTEVVLPPPGQEHLLGAHPAQAAPAEKVAARVEEDSVAEVKTASNVKAAKKGKRKTKTAVETAQVAAVSETKSDKSLYAGIEKTGVPDQADVVAEGGAGKITQINQRLADLTQPAMGGPELSGPPSPTDGMDKTSTSIRNGDELNTRQAQALSPKSDNKVQNAPAIERFDIAQATSTPMPVTPGRSSAPSRDWDVELSGSVGFGRIDTAAQNYFGSIADDFGSGSWTKSAPVSHLASSGSGGFNWQGVSTDDADDIVTYEVAAKINLTGDVEPLGGGSNVEPYLKIGVGGHQADYSTRVDHFYPGDGKLAVIPGVGAPYYNEMEEYSSAVVKPIGDSWEGDYYDYVYNILAGQIDDIVYKGKQRTIRGSLEYGQTWKGNSVDVTGFARITHTRRDIEHTLSFSGTDPEVDCDPCLPFGSAWRDFTGAYNTDLNVNTTGFGLGAGVTVPITRDKRWNIDASGYGSYDVTTVSGRDTLRIDGVERIKDGLNPVGPGYVDSVRIKATDESFGYGGTIGVSYNVTERFALRLGADYSSQEAAPVIVRDGVNPSHVDFEREDVLVGTLTAKIKF